MLAVYDRAECVGVLNRFARGELCVFELGGELATISSRTHSSARSTVVSDLEGPSVA